MRTEKSTAPLPGRPGLRLPAFKRSLRRRWIAGLCAGIADHWGWDVRLVRVLWAIVAVIPVLPGLPLYLILWLLVPSDSSRRGVG